MQYDMRRKDREETKEFALEVIDKAPFGVMATVDSDGTPYCVPLSFARDGETLIFHGALSGHKIANLDREGQVCVSFTREPAFPENDFTVVYESAVVTGTAEKVTGEEEKIRCLRLICERFTPKNMAAFDGETAKFLKVTGVWKIRMETISGKRRKPPR
ncbi:MAG: pyridoxamine 5'-phosphate oxidase family protein [Treponema sp.]|jgi:nitroimidazol reductase NimA-like FMN-containing flavoprotein (pyridoxamine 5'-phosphate oxidase superfamily)|nr:pyridoxamine 5'-phosphate oxidase family protein [Treponema sp.]